MQAQEYYQSLISQGYTAEQAKQYTVQYYPDFEPVVPTPNVTQPLPEIPIPMPLPGISPLPQGDLPPPFVGGALPKPESVETSGMEKKKFISIALAGILVVAGTIGIMYAFGVFGKGDADFVGEWVDAQGNIRAYNDNETFVSYLWWDDDPYSGYPSWPFETTWEKSGDQITSTYERTVSEDFAEEESPNNDGYFEPYVEFTRIVFKYEINGAVMFVQYIEAVQTEDDGDKRVNEYDLMDDLSKTCTAMVSKERLDFSGEDWNEDAYNTWFSMVNSADIPSWCDNEFKDEYRFSFSFEQSDSYYGAFFLTLEQSKWDLLEISDMAFFITIDGSSEIECFYDGYDGVCSYIPQFGSEKINTGSVIAFGKGDAWEADCSSGCDLNIRVVHNTDSGPILLDEFSELYVYDPGP